MNSSKRLYGPLLIAVCILASSFIGTAINSSGFLFSGDAILEKPWWEIWSRDVNRNRIDDLIEYKLEAGIYSYNIPVAISYSRPTTHEDVRLIESLGYEITYRTIYVDAIFVTIDLWHMETILNFPGVVMIEDDEEMSIHLDKSIPSMKIDGVWNDYAMKGDGVTIAVVDTGIDGNHAAFIDSVDDDSKIVAFYDVINNKDITDGSVIPYDDQGHGSHCAGIAAGTGAPDYKYVGVAPNAKLVGVKVLSKTGSGSTAGVVQGMEWVISNRDKFSIDIMSMSLGSAGYFPINNDGNGVSSRTADKAMENGIVTLTSAGNNGKQWPFLGNSPNNPDRPGSIGTPGDARKIISVGAVDVSHQKAWFSSIGPAGSVRDPYIKPDIMAVGVQVYAPKTNTGNEYVAYSGTSMSCPMAAGIVALMLQANPELSTSSVKQILIDTAIPKEASGKPVLGSGDPNYYYGHGIADAKAAVKAAGNIADGVRIFLDSPLELPVGNAVLSGHIKGCGNPTFRAYLNGKPLSIQTVDNVNWIVPVNFDSEGIYILEVRASVSGGNSPPMFQYISVSGPLIPDKKQFSLSLPIILIAVIVISLFLIIIRKRGIKIKFKKINFKDMKIKKINTSAIRDKVKSVRNRKKDSQAV